MATSYTQHYGLCQWVPEDPFLREEFNEDSQKIEAALEGAERRAQQTDAQIEALAQRTQSQLEPLGYNMYNLMLQSYYDGKQTAYKRAVIFDGFLNQSQIASLSGGLGLLAGEHCLLLNGAGQQQITYAYGDRDSFSISRGQMMSQSWTTTGNGTLTAIDLYIQGTALVEVLKNGTQLARQEVTAERKIRLAVSVPVQTGATYTLQVTNTGSTVLFFYVPGSNTQGFGYQLTFAPSPALSGTLTSTAYQVEGGTRALLWVRHSGGAVGARLKSGGVWRDMVLQGTRTTTNLSGATCTESSFLQTSQVTGPVEVQLTMATTAGSSIRVFDYGAVML